MTNDDTTTKHNPIEVTTKVRMLTSEVTGTLQHINMSHSHSATQLQFLQIVLVTVQQVSPISKYDDDNNKHNPIEVTTKVKLLISEVTHALQHINMLSSHSAMKL
jgi:hypothetical protein